MPRFSGGFYLENTMIVTIWMIARIGGICNMSEFTLIPTWDSPEKEIINSVLYLMRLEEITHWVNNNHRGDFRDATSP
jgi:hypothetical protein